MWKNKKVALLAILGLFVVGSGCTPVLADEVDDTYASLSSVSELSEHVETVTKLSKEAKAKEDKQKELETSIKKAQANKEEKSKASAQLDGKNQELSGNITNLKNQIEAKKAAIQKQKEEEAAAQEAARIAEQKKNGVPYFGSDGLLVRTASDRAQNVVNRLLAIPGHANGSAYHQNGLDALIDELTVEEATWVLWRIEGPGFGQTGDGYAGADTPESHRTLVTNQINGREEFHGSIYQLLKLWGTFTYGGY